MAKLELSVEKALKMGAAVAEEALLKVGAEGGDLAVEKVVQDMTPGQLTTIISDFDMTKSSSVSHHMSTEQFADMVDRVGLFLPEVKADEEFNLHMIQSKLEAILLPMLLDGHDFYMDRLYTFLDNENAYEIIALMAIDQKEYEEFIADPNPSLAFHNTWQQLVAEIFICYPSEYKRIVQAIDYINENNAEDEEDGGKQAKMTKIADIINLLVDKARDLVTEKQSAESEEVDSEFENM